MPSTANIIGIIILATVILVPAWIILKALTASPFKPGDDPAGDRPDVGQPATATGLNGLGSSPFHDASLTQGEQRNHV